MTYTLPLLKYDFSALEPVIDSATVEIHYAKHHSTYHKNLNVAVEKYPELFNNTIEKLLSDFNQVPEEIRTAVKNNGGGYYNHIVYWDMFSPKGGGEPKGKLAEEIKKTWPDFITFKAEMEKAGTTRFGSGWAWLSRKSNGNLIIHSTPNQDTPLSEGYYPILAFDVWEHAYYLKYQNRRAEYLANLWDIIDWDEANKRFSQAS